MTNNWEIRRANLLFETGYLYLERGSAFLYPLYADLTTKRAQHSKKLILLHPRVVVISLFVELTLLIS